jgi:hypothetical protein
MNATQVHLMLSHVPVIATILVALLIAAGLWRRSQDLLRAGLVGMVLAAALALPVFLTGEPTEERLEHVAGVSENVIERHEDFAKITFFALETLGLLALAGLARYRRRAVPQAFVATVLAFMVIEGAALTWTAHLGGGIRHTELQSAAVTTDEAREVDD